MSILIQLKVAIYASTDWWVPQGLEPGTTDPKSSMCALRTILEKAVEFWSGLLKIKFQAFFSKHVICKNLL